MYNDTALTRELKVFLGNAWSAMTRMCVCMHASMCVLYMLVKSNRHVMSTVLCTLIRAGHSLLLSTKQFWGCTVWSCTVWSLDYMHRLCQQQMMTRH